LDCATDFGVNIRPSFMEKDQAKKMEMREDLAANFIPRWLASMEKQLASTGGVYFAEKMTVADIMIALRIKGLKGGVLDGIPTTIADSYPNLIALHESVTGEPKIAAFIAKHAK
ncbi:unnamed protein product, partial [Laminaria digitata]